MSIIKHLDKKFIRVGYNKELIFMIKVSWVSITIIVTLTGCLPVTAGNKSISESHEWKHSQTPVFNVLKYLLHKDLPLIQSLFSKHRLPEQLEHNDFLSFAFNQPLY